MCWQLLESICLSVDYHLSYAIFSAESRISHSLSFAAALDLIQVKGQELEFNPEEEVISSVFSQ